MISIAFALLAPLGLFRGPLTLFGCGAATLGILKGIGFSTPYLFALMVIPSITMNVIHLYDTELDCMGSKLCKSINQRASEKDIAGCMDCLYHHAGDHLHYVWLRRSFK